MTQKRTLKNWAEFQRLRKLDRIEWTWLHNKDGHEQHELLSRFAARWQFAANLSAIEVVGASDRARLGYLAGTRVALAFSALEHLMDCTLSQSRHAVNKVALTDAALATRLRSALRTSRLVTSENVSADDLRKRLATWIDGKDDDVLIVARALRHMFAHGAFTPYGLNVTTKTSREAVEALAERVLTEAEDRFVAWVAEHQRPAETTST